MADEKKAFTYRDDLLDERGLQLNSHLGCVTGLAESDKDMAWLFVAINSNRDAQACARLMPNSIARLAVKIGDPTTINVVGPVLTMHGVTTELMEEAMSLVGSELLSLDSVLLVLEFMHCNAFITGAHENLCTFLKLEDAGASGFRRPGMTRVPAHSGVPPGVKYDNDDKDAVSKRFPIQLLAPDYRSVVGACLLARQLSCLVKKGQSSVDSIATGNRLSDVEMALMSASSRMSNRLYACEDGHTTGGMVDMASVADFLTKIGKRLVEIGDSSFLIRIAIYAPAWSREMTTEDQKVRPPLSSIQRRLCSEFASPNDTCFNEFALEMAHIGRSENGVVSQTMRTASDYLILSFHAATMHSEVGAMPTELEPLLNDRYCFSLECTDSSSSDNGDERGAWHVSMPDWLLVARWRSFLLDIGRIESQECASRVIRLAEMERSDLELVSRLIWTPGLVDEDRALVTGRLMQCEVQYRLIDTRFYPCPANAKPVPELKKKEDDDIPTVLPPSWQVQAEAIADAIEREKARVEMQMRLPPPSDDWENADAIGLPVTSPPPPRRVHPGFSDLSLSSSSSSSSDSSVSLPPTPPFLRKARRRRELREVTRHSRRRNWDSDDGDDSPSSSLSPSRPPVQPPPQSPPPPALPADQTIWTAIVAIIMLLIFIRG
jgi:hypothetical protein